MLSYLRCTCQPPRRFPLAVPVTVLTEDGRPRPPNSDDQKQVQGPAEGHGEDVHAPLPSMSGGLLTAELQPGRSDRPPHRRLHISSFREPGAG